MVWKVWRARTPCFAALMHIRFLGFVQDDFQQPFIADGCWHLALCHAFRGCTRFQQARHLRFSESLHSLVAGGVAESQGVCASS